ncbi:MAG: asparagine synthase (glutamine-hydrolyzing) [Phycisphaerales bacterium]|nr:asparagine synthase (glutamine-hydrolyzing) [Phycisphaerales bacterium]
MCGIFGIATVAGRSVTLSDQRVCRFRDMLAHRGPNGAGLWRSDGEVGGRGQFVLAHRRLAVIDPTQAGSQPMLMDDRSFGVRGRARWAIAYNGELYNDRELRDELGRETGGWGGGGAFRTSCDTETLLHVMARWGTEGVSRLRGMFAFALVDQVRRTLVLTRDPLGIKPLYYKASEREIVFASEPAPIMEYADAPPRPDMVAASAYMTTIRTTLDDRTLFEGVRCVRPGESIEFRLDGAEPVMRRHQVSTASAASGNMHREESVREVVADSIGRHLRSDVATCCLLSGGLDSSIIVSDVRRRTAGEIRTYCSGHDDGQNRGDLAFAEQAASHFGTSHTAAPVSRQMFADRWPEMVGRMGVPLSTPNEVAINEVARRLHADGQVVALSGEGADELFGGYELPLRLAMQWEAARSGNERAESRVEAAARFQLDSNAWVPIETKAAILRPDVWKGVEQDCSLVSAYRDVFAQGAPEQDGVGAHLTFHRRVNLVGLLVRLDTATMLEGVEGRTPFADVRVCEFAESLPTARKFAVEGEAMRTKIALREAFAGVLPSEIIQRPKASFPLPFQDWVIDAVPALQRSEFSRSMFREEAIAQVCAQPGALWRLAWPMVNLALWGERWWPGRFLRGCRTRGSGRLTENHA